MGYFFIYLFLLFEARRIFFGEVESFETVELREKRHLVYPPPGVGNAPTKVQLILGLGLPMEGGLIVGYVLKHNYNLPYNTTMFTNPYLQYQRSIYKEDPSEPNVHAESRRRTTRWETYKMLESALNIFGSGKSCLLRTICEAAGAPFTENHGLLGELLQVFLAPSTTAEEFSESGDQEYFAAELLGRRSLNKCRKFSQDCQTSPLEYFTEN